MELKVSLSTLFSDDTAPFSFPYKCYLTCNTMPGRIFFFPLSILMLFFFLLAIADKAIFNF